MEIGLENNFLHNKIGSTNFRKRLLLLWYARLGSNQRLSAPEADALSTELRALKREVGMRNAECGIWKKQMNLLPLIMDLIGLWIRFRLDFLSPKIEPNLIHIPGQVKMKRVSMLV